MLGRTLSRLLSTLAILAASVAWIGWLYLHTAGDPTRSDRVAHAILDDPRARSEVAADIAQGIAGATNQAATQAARRAGLQQPTILVSGDDPSLQKAVDAALADPRIAANLIDAISAEHAIALGVKPAHPAVIDTTTLVAAVRFDLGGVDPVMAKAIPNVAAGQIKLPKAQIPLARQARTFANRWVGWLSLGALFGFVIAFLLGERERVLRRAGGWALGAGLAWAAIPPLITAAADAWVKSQAAVVKAIVHGVTGTVTATATLLAVAGVAMIVLSFVGARLVRGLGHGLAAAGGAAGAGAGVLAGPPVGGPPVGSPPASDPATGWSGAYPSPVHRSPSDRFAASDSWNPQSPPADPGVYDRFGQAGHARRQSVISVGPEATPPTDDGGWQAPVDPPA
jgi:hypothetical protein